MCRDHPRSRGVYAYVVALPSARGGSSPLARGLHRQHLGDERLGGIIPARAGFTPTAHQADGAGRDHPRSRGVYVEVINLTEREDGSSPLARGLRLRQVLARRNRGSSPLARGLPAAVCGDHAWHGIIPARAGFTGTSTPSQSPRQDHPRSRGVYG